MREKKKSYLKLRTVRFCMLQLPWNLPWTLTSGYLATSPMISVDWRFTISAVTNGFSLCIARMSGKGPKKIQGKCLLYLWKSMHIRNISDSKMNIFFSRNESDTSKSGPIPQHQVAVLVKVYHWSGGALSLDPVVGVRSYLWVPEGTPEHSIIVGSYHTGDAFLGLWGNDKCWYMYVYVTEGVQVFSFFVILTTHISNLDHMSICSTVIFGSFSKFLIWNCLSCNGHIWTMYHKLTLSTGNYFADFYNTNQKQICWKFKLALFYSTIIVI